MNKKFKHIAIMGGHSNIGFNFLTAMAKTDISTSLVALQEPVRLKEGHKTEEMKRAEILHKLRQGLTDGMIEEYLLIQKKESKLSRSKRDYIVYQIESFVFKGILTKDELNLIKQ